MRWQSELSLKILSRTEYEKEKLPEKPLRDLHDARSL